MRREQQRMCIFRDVVYTHLSQKFNKTELSHRKAAVAIVDKKTALLQCYGKCGTELKK